MFGGSKGKLFTSFNRARPLAGHGDFLFKKDKRAGKFIFFWRGSKRNVYRDQLDFLGIINNISRSKKFVLNFEE